MLKYLYGASIQGIQEFIFKTNKLAQIVGASQILKSIHDDFEQSYRVNNLEIYLNAAGNIRVVLSDKNELEKIVKEFPKKVMQKAYGISISQAVIEINSDITKDELKLLDDKLKASRNKATIPLDIRLSIMDFVRNTARAPVLNEKKINGAEKIDKGSLQKYEKSDKNEISAIKNQKNKIAVIHADGNNIGDLIPTLKNIPDFSKNLNKATKESFTTATKAIKNGKFREIILGGDDMTIICDADFALDFTKVYLTKFEELTTKFTEHHLTACAGITFCNDKFPFHYAINLAENLCGIAKNHTKNLNSSKPSSCLMFHNVQSSNFQTWDKFVQDELSVQSQDISFDFGPYYLNEPNQPSIDNLIEICRAYADDSSPISSLREWIRVLDNASYAEFMLDRINEILDKSWADKEFISKLFANLSNKNLITKKDGKNKTPIYDILQIHAVTQNIKEQL
ncbi:Cas10/Cmr2 second palm domain-containing protein [Campylobacter hyointestinalis]|uniref:Cas10/Cmr2 second palm domain-containing protein n=1 Tax=Campylobacter hyointestinalis TaxID=198 RepID=UPI0011ACC5F3|nr:hypothetical protein [Campylobacter hyointestinalis]TWO22395.1 hypothetical protein YZ80_02990 [Campylobacter hyointestinalis]